MANIYEERTEGLHELLDRARADDGATVLIPDLQRPFVWTPNQVSLLVDSLIRGWPFGTLLMWKVGQCDLQNIPHRQFWRVVERTDDSNGSTVTRKDPPASYHMVLDGQQRVQSLLLALGGDAWGFKLEDRDWARELQDRRPRGRQGKDPHWSKASLCFDLNRFLEKYAEHGRNLLAVDFHDDKVLQWAITDPSDGQSKWLKPNTYAEPLQRAFSEENKGRFIRLSRLWAAAKPNPNIKEAQFRENLKELFMAEGVPGENVEKLLVPMGELMTTLRDVKLSKVTYLELLAFDKQVWKEDAYNDAIVNIFTRLNHAGRTLTREEITLAWLKVGWEPKETGGKTAGDCFLELLADLADRGLEIEMDSLVSAVSFIWSVCDNGGLLLANRDLLRGATIRPMASALASRWNDIRRALLMGLEAVNGRGLEYGSGGQYSSLNALAVVWAWLHLALQWESGHGMTVTRRDDFHKKCLGTLDSILDRWLICSQWAGCWAGSSSTVIAGFAQALHEDFLACNALGTLEEVHQILSNRFQSLVTDLDTEATKYVTTLAAGSRERVSVYRTVLWIWHRLDAERWKMSSIPLRVGRSKPSLDVDHAVAHALWDKKIAAALPQGIDDRNEAILLVNLLGNCSLLEKTFNISKSDKTLRSFMEQVHEIKEGKVTLSSWGQALGLTDVMLDAATADTDAVVLAMQERDKTIRAELIEFVKGLRVRADSPGAKDYPPPGEPNPGPRVQKKQVAKVQKAKDALRTLKLWEAIFTQFDVSDLGITNQPQPTMSTYMPLRVGFANVNALLVSEDGLLRRLQLAGKMLRPPCASGQFPPAARRHDARRDAGPCSTTFPQKSAAIWALLFAEHEPRIKGCIAYAPLPDLFGRAPSKRASVETAFPGIARLSPQEGIERLKCPVFVFHAEDDRNISIEITRRFVELLKQTNSAVTFHSVPTGGHYQSMIRKGIPQGIQWLKSLPAEAKAEPTLPVAGKS